MSACQHRGGCQTWQSKGHNAFGRLRQEQFGPAQQVVRIAKSIQVDQSSAMRVSIDNLAEQAGLAAKGLIKAWLRNPGRCG